MGGNTRRLVVAGSALVAAALLVAAAVAPGSPVHRHSNGTPGPTKNLQVDLSRIDGYGPTDGYPGQPTTALATVSSGKNSVVARYGSCYSDYKTRLQSGVMLDVEVTRSGCSTNPSPAMVVKNTVYDTRGVPVYCSETIQQPDGSATFQDLNADNNCRSAVDTHVVPVWPDYTEEVWMKGDHWAVGYSALAPAPDDASRSDFIQLDFSHNQQSVTIHGVDGFYGRVDTSQKFGDLTVANSKTDSSAEIVDGSTSDGFWWSAPTADGSRTVAILDYMADGYLWGGAPPNGDNQPVSLPKPSPDQGLDGI